MDVSVSQTSGRRKPSPWWLLCIVPFSTIAVTAALAPRVEIYTSLACKAHKPIASDQDLPLVLGSTVNWSYATLPFHPSFQVSDIGTPFESKTNIATVGENPCASDPVVQATAAKLIAVITASTGVLSCLTGAWWGAFSDRYGRTKVLRITAIAAAVTDVNLILVTLFTDKFPGGYWFLITGPLIEGMVGGMASESAASYAYIADTTAEEARSRIFSLALGLSFVGAALGPMIGSLLTRSTGQVLSVFFLSSSIRLASALFLWLVVPTSLTKERTHMDRGELESRRGHLFKYLASQKFLDPLAIFIPQKNDNPLKKGNKDWSLALVALIYSLINLTQGSVNYTFQYLTYSFDWSSETLGYYVGVTGFIRAICLMVIIPALTKFLQSKARTVEHPTQLSEEEPLLSVQNTPRSTGSSAARRPKDLRSPLLDMNIVYISLVIEAVAYTSMGLSRSSLIFWLSAILLTLGSGVFPAIQSLILDINARNGGVESGKLFGALGVMTALSSQIIGPSMFGGIYASTVTWFPQCIFFVLMIIVSVSFILLCFVRSSKVVPQDEVANTDIENSSLASTEVSR